MKVTVGRIVHYRLSAADVTLIDQQRPQCDENGRWLRNHVHEGSVLPAIVTAVFDPQSGTANLVVQLDGHGQYWATSRKEGNEPGTWFWPPRD